MKMPLAVWWFVKAVATLNSRTVIAFLTSNSNLPAGPRLVFAKSKFQRTTPDACGKVERGTLAANLVTGRCWKGDIKKVTGIVREGPLSHQLR